MWVQLSSGGYVNLNNVTSLQVGKAAGGGGFTIRADGSPAMALDGGPYETREQAHQAIQDLIRPGAETSASEPDVTPTPDQPEPVEPDAPTPAPDPQPEPDAPTPAKRGRSKSPTEHAGEPA